MLGGHGGMACRLAGVDYLQHGAVAEASTWVFGKVGLALLCRHASAPSMIVLRYRRVLRHPLPRRVAVATPQVIHYLQAHGYNDANLKAAPYDWRLPPQFLEERDAYFSKLAQLIHSTAVANQKKVVLLA